MSESKAKKGTRRPRSRWTRTVARVRRHFRAFPMLVPLLVLLAALCVGTFLVRSVATSLQLGEADVKFGATFSTKYAEELGLDWKETYLAVLDELEVRHLRIPAYWDEIEPERGKFDFTEVDWQVEQARQRDAEVVLAVGMKLPRWPECHIPEWAVGMTKEQRDARVLVMLKETVAHLSRHGNIYAWQVENEPLFRFGECPPPDRDFLKREVELVRELDERPVIITESGELSDWIRAATLADILGISTYRSVWNRWIGRFYWPVGPDWYARRIETVSRFVDEVFVSELQAEPWSPGPIYDMAADLQVMLMNPKKLADNVSFVRRMGVDRAYLWGVEWWYWLKINGSAEMWEAGRGLFP